MDASLLCARLSGSAVRREGGVHRYQAPRGRDGRRWTGRQASDSPSGAPSPPRSTACRFGASSRSQHRRWQSLLQLFDALETDRDFGRDSRVNHEHRQFGLFCEGRRGLREALEVVGEDIEQHVAIDEEFTHRALRRAPRRVRARISSVLRRMVRRPRMCSTSRRPPGSAVPPVERKTLRHKDAPCA